ncbi:divergent polysaccharide deacetylase family protein [Pseudoalteromonas xiamenensis]
MLTNKITSYLLGIALFLLPCAVAQAARIAIVIDDIGYHQRDMDLLNLPGTLTYSILPHTPYSQRFAFKASQQGKELLLHVPMESTNDKLLGPGGLTSDMGRLELQSTLGHALASLPQVKGVNNHMGSRLTQETEPMRWTMEILKKRGLFFLDSRTTVQTQAQHVANLVGVMNISRNVFLDNDLNEEAMLVQLEELKRIATQNQFAVAIAHPYPETQSFLLAQLPLLSAQGFELVPVSQLVENKYIQLADKAPETPNTVSHLTVTP